MPDVTVYTGSFCGSCLQVTSLLERRGIAYTEVSVEDHPDLREKLLERSGRRTLPQVYFGERYHRRAPTSSRRSTGAANS